MTAVETIPKADRRVRALRGIYKLQLKNGPAAAQTVIAQALKLSDAGVGAWIWGRFLRPLGKLPLAERKRWLPSVLKKHRQAVLHLATPEAGAVVAPGGAIGPPGDASQGG